MRVHAKAIMRQTPRSVVIYHHDQNRKEQNSLARLNQSDVDDHVPMWYLSAHRSSCCLSSARYVLQITTASRSATVRESTSQKQLNVPQFRCNWLVRRFLIRVFGLVAMVSSHGHALVTHKRPFRFFVLSGLPSPEETRRGYIPRYPVDVSLVSRC
jgi:hypothetical protein